MEDFVSSKEIYRVGDMVKYEYLKNNFSTAKILSINANTVDIKIGLPNFKKSDIFEDVLKDIPYSQIIPYERYLKLYKK